MEEETNIEEKKNMKQLALEKTEKLICALLDGELDIQKIELLDKLIDIHKDIKNEEYWEGKLDMYYNDYGNYDRGYMRGGYGAEGQGSRNRGNYRARGYDTKYKGEEMLDEMHNTYREYNEGKEEFNRGNYRAKEDTMKSLDYMLQSTVDFIEMLQRDAQSQEEVELIKKYTRKISEM